MGSEAGRRRKLMLVPSHSHGAKPAGDLQGTGLQGFSLCCSCVDAAGMQEHHLPQHLQHCPQQSPRQPPSESCRVWGPRDGGAATGTKELEEVPEHWLMWSMHFTVRRYVGCRHRGRAFFLKIKVIKNSPCITTVPSPIQNSCEPGP